jgi:hypothetical protein
LAASFIFHERDQAAGLSPLRYFWKSDLPVGLIFRIRVKSAQQKHFAFSETRSGVCRNHPASSRGALRPIVTKREAGMRWTRWLASDDCRPMRTSEIVWSRLPTLRSSAARRIAGATVANKPGTPRRARISREPSRRECRHVRRTCDDLRACFLPFCTQGNGCVRHPAFPAPS